VTLTVATGATARKTPSAPRGLPKGVEEPPRSQQIRSESQANCLEILAIPIPEIRGRPR